MSKNIPKERKHKKKKKKTSSKHKKVAKPIEKFFSDTIDFFKKLIEETEYSINIKTVKKSKESKHKKHKSKQHAKPKLKSKPIKIDDPNQYILDKLKEISRDANDHYKNERYGEFLRLKYLSIEILAKAVYFKLFNKEICKENNLNLTEIIEAIEQKVGVNFVIVRELNEWRIIRNKIVHEHLKIDEKQAAKANVFLDRSNSLLQSQLVN